LRRDEVASQRDEGAKIRDEVVMRRDQAVGKAIKARPCGALRLMSGIRRKK
jgi:hypothetical protein